MQTKEDLLSVLRNKEIELKDLVNDRFLILNKISIVQYEINKIKKRLKKEFQVMDI